MTRPSKLDHDTLEKWLESHSQKGTGWEKTRAGEFDAIARTFKFPDFSAAVAFVVRVGMAAEKRDHHPDIELGWGRAKIVWTTHDQKGVTSLDTELAEATDSIFGTHG
jgi:4a-hydroxytetrahydrobiopterin dehydratase